MSRALLALLVGAAALSRAELVSAGSHCGGGSSGGGSSSGGSSSGGSSGGGSSGGSWSSDWSSSSSSSADTSSGCTDDTDIVGYRQCTRFGAWSNARVPAISIETGLLARTFTSPLGDATGTVSHDAETFTYRASGTPAHRPGPSGGSSSASSDSALLFTLRLEADLPRGLYAAIEGEVGGLVRNSSHVEMTSTGTLGAPSIEPGGGLVLGGAGVLGVRGALGASALGAELAVGGRSITYRYDSHYLACETSSSQTAGAPVVEARVRATHWLSPFVHVGATAGAGVIDRGSWVLGLHLGFTARAYGGQRD